MRDTLREQLAKEVTRKQFLQYLAAAALSLFGLTNLLHLLSGSHLAEHLGAQAQAGKHGFGSSKFGV